MRMKVTDQLHVSSVSPHTMGKGTEFDVSADLGKQFEKRGLATTIGETTARDAPESGRKAEDPPLNKAEPPPVNKAEIPPIDIPPVNKTEHQPSGKTENHPAAKPRS